jgi:putative acetyltransferase
MTTATSATPISTTSPTATRTTAAFRVSTTGDLQSLERIYPAAFPDEDLLPVVRSLVTGSVDVLSLVAEDDGKVVGHVAFTICSVGDVSAGSVGPALRGPGSAQTRDRQRAGSRGVQASAGSARSIKVLVLGDPAILWPFRLRARARDPRALSDACRVGGCLAVRVARATGADQMEGPLVVPGVWQDPVPLGLELSVR